MKKLIPFLLLLLFISGCKKDKTSFFNTWKLKSYLRGPGERVVNSNFKMEITFSKDSIYNVQLNTNTCTGSFYKKGTELNILGGGCTEMCCDSLNSQEAWTLYLDSVVKHEVSVNNLKLKGNNYVSLDFELVD